MIRFGLIVIVAVMWFALLGQLLGAAGIAAACTAACLIWHGVRRDRPGFTAAGMWTAASAYALFGSILGAGLAALAALVPTAMTAAAWHASHARR